MKRIIVAVGLFGVLAIIASTSAAAEPRAQLACRARNAVCVKNEECCSNHCTVQTHTGWKCGD